MALRNCPECGKQISTDAKACPHCGKSFAPSESKRAVLGCLFIVVITIVMSMCIASNENVPTSPAVDQAVADANLQSSAKERIKTLLRDPSSADFRSVIVVRKASGVTVCGEVNAKNGFGGRAGFASFMVYGTTATIQSTANDAAFVKRWNARCAT